MAIQDAPFGFTPIGSMAGGAFNGPLLECNVPGDYGVDLFVGDLVMLVGIPSTSVVWANSR